MTGSSLTPAVFDLLGQAFQRYARALGQRGFAGLLLAVFGDFARLFAVGDDHELIAGLRQAFQAEDLDRGGRRRGFEHTSTIIEHGAYLAEDVAHDKVLARVQRSILYQHGGYRTAPAVQLGLQHAACSGTLGNGLQVLQVGDQADHFQQQVEIGLLLGGDVDKDRRAAPIFRQQSAIGQLLLDPIGQRARLVDLVYGDDDRDLGGVGVIDGLQGLRHHAVIGGHHQHYNVGDLRSAGTHAGEGFVARGIEEDDLAAVGGRAGVGDLHLVSADVLSDAAGFAFGYVGGANGVEQAGLAVIDVAHDGDHRRTRYLSEYRLVVSCQGLRLHLLLHLRFEADQVGTGAELARHVAGQLGIERLVDGGKDAASQQAGDNILGADSQSSRPGL